MNDIRVGFVGLGLMGSEFTYRLIEQGFSVSGCDRAPEKITAVETFGVTAAGSPAETADTTDQVHICVMTAQDLEDVVFGRDGVSSQSGRCKILVDHSTTPVKITQEFAQRLNSQTGIEWVDAPVSGGPAAARNGALSIMAGGSEDVIAQAMPVLRALGECTHMGEVGAGQVSKMVNQILVLNNYCILAESLALAEAGGVDPQKIPKALAQGHAGSNLLQALYPRMIARDYKPAGYAFQVLKDLHMVSELAQSLGVATPMSERATSLFQELNDGGDGELDGISVLKLYLDH